MPLDSMISGTYLKSEVVDVVNDSVILADTVHVELCPLIVNPLDTAMAISSRPASFLYGLEPGAKMHNPGNDSFILGAFIALVVFFIFNFKSLHRFLGVYGKALYKLRKSENVFDDHTASEARINIMLVVQWCFCVAVILYFWLYSVYMPVSCPTYGGYMGTIGRLFLLAVVYYVLQFLSYAVVAYAFAPDRNVGAQWLKGYEALNAYMSLGLMIPALVMIFYFEGVKIMAIVSLGLFIISKIVFIYKGFRIFYHNFWSLLYFILYLCALEIIPVFLVYRIAGMLVTGKMG